ncbi:MAG: hypothetical protein COX57_05850 [Alphaproteobacteria bacterium CG_4_10_14_0_2_um_filter_63_37]|nr:MAG: hypothetical protein COX57_05850 [Alphaproteobacteria bacterium CG_4_10_14_0_2_um_filter_63_37]
MKHPDENQKDSATGGSNKPVWIARGEYDEVLRRINDAIAERGLSFREFAEQSKRLSPPERFHHTTFSKLEPRGSDEKAQHLSLQRMLAIAKLLGKHPSEFFSDNPILTALELLKPDDRKVVLGMLVAMLRSYERGDVLLAKIRKAYPRLL